MADSKYLDQNGLLYFWQKIKNLVAANKVTKTSELTNDSGFITSAEAGSNYTLTQDSSDGHKLTFTKEGGSSTTITIPDNDTTYSKLSELENDNQYASRLYINNGADEGTVDVGAMTWKDGFDTAETIIYDKDFTIRGYGRTTVSQWAGNYLDIETPEYDEASTSASGLMSSTDKSKLNGIAEGANNVTKTSELTNDSGYLTKTDLGAVLKYKGNVNSFADLPTENLEEGDVYNIATAGGTDAHGVEIKAGDNVAYNGTGWDVLAGTVDLSGYVSASNSITNTEIDTIVAT